MEPMQYEKRWTHKAKSNAMRPYYVKSWNKESIVPRSLDSHQKFHDTRRSTHITDPVSAAKPKGDGGIVPFFLPFIQDRHDEPPFTSFKAMSSPSRCSIREGTRWSRHTPLSWLVKGVPCICYNRWQRRLCLRNCVCPMPFRLAFCCLQGLFDL